MQAQRVQMQQEEQTKELGKAIYLVPRNGRETSSHNNMHIWASSAKDARFEGIRLKNTTNKWIFPEGSKRCCPWAAPLYFLQHEAMSDS